MRDHPLSTLLPIMLETAEMSSSDAEELAEEFDQDIPASARRQFSSLSTETTSSTDSRRSSLPSDRPGSVILRHLNHLKVRRKTSAPCVPREVMGQNKQCPPLLTNPLASLTGSPLIDLLEKLRPRQSSTTDSGVSSMPASVRTGSNRRRSVDTAQGLDSRGSRRVSEGCHSGNGEEAIWKPLFVDTHLANANTNGLCPATVPRRCLYYRQSSLAGGGADEAHYRCQRQRSNSETGRYLLMRKCSDLYGGTDIIGKLETEWAYCQILATMKCCDLMPSMSKMVVVDSNLTVRKAFHALVLNDIRAAPIWDSKHNLFVGLLTTTDLIHMLIEYVNNVGSTVGDIDGEQSKEESHGQASQMRMEDMLSSTLRQHTSLQRISPKHSNGGEGTNQSQHYFGHLIYVCAEESVAKAAKLLCDRRLHRLPVLDPEKGGNPLFLLSKKDVLKALRKYIAKLPLPACMERTLDDLNIGTWIDLITVSYDTTLHQALNLFITNRVSALPVVNERYQIVDMLTKVDVMNLIIDEKGSVDGILNKTVSDATKTGNLRAEKMTTCSKKATLLLAVERLLHSDAHRLAIVDSDGKLEGIIAMLDLMRFLTVGFL